MDKFIRNRTACLFLVGLVLVGSGCNRDPQSVPRVKSNPFVPEHSLRSKFMGTWIREDGETEIIIEESDDGKVMMRSLDTDEWDMVINYVGFEDNDLVYELYNYNTKNARHEFNGLSWSVKLTPNKKDYSELKASYTVNNAGVGFSYTLTRLPI